MYALRSFAISCLLIDVLMLSSIAGPPVRVLGAAGRTAAAAPLSHQILGSPAAQKAAPKPTSNPFASPTINLTATSGPLPEYFFATSPPLAGYGSPMQVILCLHSD